tara:strand:- start:1893 stop:2243 length:351 start_codon:yes stop_codon:yes gene_type:complete
MKNSIKLELASHIIDRINDGVIDNSNRDEWHFHCFNEDFYIIYHSAAIEWLKQHNLDTFEAIEIVKEYEESNFGEMTTGINPEAIVNMLAYIYGEELLNSFDVDTVEELKTELENI